MSAPPSHFSHLSSFRHLLHLLHFLLFREVLPYLLLFITFTFSISSSSLHFYLHLHYLKFVTSSHLLVFIITSLSSSPSPLPYAPLPPRFLLYLLHLLLFRHLLLHLSLVPFLLRPPPRKRVRRERRSFTSSLVARRHARLASRTPREPRNLLAESVSFEKGVGRKFALLGKFIISPLLLHETTDLSLHLPRCR